ncbi:TAXI family TRAP transporter solute-binding subunit [Heyndrickxia sp. NPDC080065]|uniref:TAXI family TRAP transporter solute-binding subunit n=1 Tax=Heyndrickxia sp. NPDC080065 TaxID=3390568 RepID=UPI003D034515
MKTGTLLNFLFLWVILLTGCTNDNQKVTSHFVFPTPEKISDDQRSLIIATGDMSGVYFSLGQALADLFEKYNGTASGTQVTNASIHNTKLVSQKQAELGFSTVDVLALPETNKTKLRALTGLYSNYIQIVTTKESGIHSLKDLRGKRVSLGTDGSGTKLMSERILKAANLANHQMQLFSLSFTQSADALRNGTIDAAFFSSGLPNPEISALDKELDIRLVPVPIQIIEQLHDQYGFYNRDVIGSQTYHGVSNKIQTITVKNVLLTYPDLPNQEAFQLVKTIFEHLPELKTVHPAAADINDLEAIKGIPIDFHPGANQYLKDNIKKFK